MNNLKIPLIAMIMIVLWGSAYVGIRAGLTDYSPGAMALLRYLVASLCMFFIYGRTLKFRKMKWADFFAIAILGILGFSIYNVTLNYGEITVTAGIASFIISQVPVLITLVSVVFFKERLAWFGWLGTCLCFVGIFLMAFGEGHGYHIDYGVLYILIATIAGCIYAILQKPLLKRVHPIEFTAYAIWCGTLVLLIYLPSLIEELPRASFSATAAVIYNGIFPAAIAYLLWSYLLTLIPATKAAAFLYIVPFVTLIIAVVILKEIPAPLAILGGAMALLGAILVHRGSKIK